MSSSEPPLPEVNMEPTIPVSPEMQRYIEQALQKEREKVEKQAREKEAVLLKALADERAEKAQAIAEKAQAITEKAQAIAEKQQLVAEQTIDEYIAFEFQRNYHLRRLLPKRATVKSKGRKVATATTGRTSIAGKYYPLKLELWGECESLLVTAFQEVHSALGNRPVFPSKNQIEAADESFLDDLPAEFANSPFWLTEARTSFFSHEVLEKPTTRILNAFLAKHKIFFNGQDAREHIRFITREQMQDTSQASGAQQSGKKAGEKARVPNKLLPDCIVLCTEADQRSKTGHCVAFGEHKAAHRLRAGMLRRLLEKGIDQDYIVQMARQRASGIPSIDYEMPVPESLPEQIYYTYALAQTYHFMVSAGILYGYLASGGTLTFLHIPKDEPTTLLYRPFLFPQFGKGVFAARKETVASVHTPVGLLSGLVFMAWKAGVQNERWRTGALQKLAKFPDLPGSVATSAAAELDQPDQPRFGLRKPVFLPTNRLDPVSFQPLRPYCTQACLLGLVRGLPLDSKCPNVLLHRRAACDVMTADEVLPGRQGQMYHAIRGIEALGQLLVLQLYGNIVQDCQCLLDKRLAGRIGCLFKLTLTGYGYTFVAKGVHSFDRRRLARETAVYEHLSEQQGRLVPVYLGIVQLLLPYPRDDAQLMTHMMLMSYGGQGLWSSTQADPEQDAARTWDELQALGVVDRDVENMTNNFTWCDEAQRMMRVDFDCARVTKSARAGAASKEGGSAKRRCSTENDALTKRVFRRRGSESSIGSPMLL